MLFVITGLLLCSSAFHILCAQNHNNPLKATPSGFPHWSPYRLEVKIITHRVKDTKLTRQNKEHYTSNDNFRRMEYFNLWIAYIIIFTDQFTAGCPAALQVYSAWNL